ncbi:MAG: hypothetical protein H0V66_01825 [Bdellovibrionales bacterium]|nr:hypothetical protein [Bdellovibrionales bacterium]
MLKKFSLMMLSFVLLTVQANAGTNNSLALAIEELNYSLTVEWDQKDQTYYNTKMKAFATTIADLQAKGLTNQQLVEHVVSTVKNESLAKDVQTTLNMIQINKMSPIEAQKAVKELMDQSYNHGASWSGGAAEAIVAVAFIAIVAYAIVWGIGASCVSRCEKDCSILGNSCTEDCGVRCN